MKLSDAIQKRRSVRSFKDKKVDYRDVFDCLDSTLRAPMAGGYFSLSFLILDQKEDIKKIAEYAEQDFIKDAKYIVMFVTNATATKKLYKERADSYLSQQAGAAIQNFLLSITQKGLSTCWIGHFNEERLKRKFQIPASKKVEAIFPIGYEKGKPKTREVVADLYNRMNFNEWGNKRMKRPTIEEPFARAAYRGTDI